MNTVVFMIFCRAILYLPVAVYVSAEFGVCPEVLFEYDGQCFSKCPAATKLLDGCNICSDECPDNLPFSFGNNCMEKCPPGYFISHPKSCIQNKQATASLGQHKPNSYTSCPVIFKCNGLRPFCYKLQCFKQCPYNTKVLGFQCVDFCPRNKPYIFNNSCTTSCPLAHAFRNGMVCSSSCDNGLQEYGTQCVENCPPNTVSFKSKCLSFCPTTSPFVLTYNNRSSCHEKCPPTTAVNNFNCDLNCPPNRPFLMNKTCVKSCPAEHPYLMNKDTGQSTLSLCLAICPVDKFIDGLSCVSNCIPEMVSWNKTCQSNCPASTPYIDMKGGSRICVAQCPNVIYQNACKDECPNETYLLNSSICVQECPPSKPFHELRYFNFECVEQCDEYTYLYNNRCINYCPGDLKKFDFMCVDDCRNTSKPFVDTRSARCVSKCPENTFINGFSCVSRCPSSMKYTLNNQCHKSCPESHPYYRERRWGYSRFDCLKKCYNYEFIYFNKCVTHCPTGYKSYESNCVINCKPTSKPFEYQSKCVSKCPDHVQNNNFICVSRCPTSSNYIFNKTCLAVCPASYPYISSGYSGKECLASCDKLQVENSSLCADTCPKGTYENNKLCVHQCPSDAPYVSLNRACLPDCKIYLNKSCADHCPFGTCLEHNKCLSINETKLIYMKKEGEKHLNVCVSECPSSAIVFKNICRDDCPEPLVLFNGSCKEHCPLTHPYTDESNLLSKRCVRKCGNDRVIYKTQCRKSCPFDRPLSANATCVKQCPKNLPYHEHGSVGMECKSKCKSHPYINENKCVSQCPWDRRLTAGNVCYSKCPPSYPYKVGRDCLSECTGDNVVLWNETTCKTKSDCTYDGKLILDDAVCVETCPNNTIYLPSLKQCKTVKRWEINLSIILVLGIPISGIIFCILCHGNFKIKCGKSKDNEYHVVGTDEDDTCVMEVYNENNTLDDVNTNDSRDIQPLNDSKQLEGIQGFTSDQQLRSFTDDKSQKRRNQYHVVGTDEDETCVMEVDNENDKLDDVNTNNSEDIELLHDSKQLEGMQIPMGEI